MLEYEEKRDFIRMSMDCPVNYKLIDSEQTLKGRCTSLSGAGLSFIAEKNYDTGKSLEINILPENSMMPTITAFVETVRQTRLDSGQYEIAAQIKSIKNA